MNGKQHSFLRGVGIAARVVVVAAAGVAAWLGVHHLVADATAGMNPITAWHWAWGTANAASALTSLAALRLLLWPETKAVAKYLQPTSGSSLIG